MTATPEPALSTPWSQSDRPLPRRFVQPLVQFLQTEASGGLLLLASAVLALAWANSPWKGGYEQLWHTEATLRLGPWNIAGDLRELMNDGLMTLFFMVVGLEIKRELTVGELREPKAAALPIAGALGGMVLPALIFLAVNPSGPGARGWGIPMATDIAFAVGVLGVFGRRLPQGLRLFVLALAIVDDIGAILVIALYYSGGPQVLALAMAVLFLGAVVASRLLGLRAVPIYALLGVGLWIALREAGIHPTLAGVVLGLLTPVVPFQPPAGVSWVARRVADETVDDPRPPDADAPKWLYLAALAREAAPPSARLESMLHPWTSFVILPLFALANAGVDFGGVLGSGGVGSVASGVALALVFGKGLGIVGGAALATRLGAARLPEGVRWAQIFGASIVAGIGFTVALFVANLAFADPSLLGQAKLGVLSGSVVAALVGALVLWRTSKRRIRAGEEPQR